MNTVGNIIDQISILEQRIRVKTEKKENIEGLYEQMGWLFKEMGEQLARAFAGNRPFVFAKNKVYDSEVKIEDNMTFLEAIYTLNQMNQKLWALEDIRRDLTLSDKERLAAADSVSVHNKIRNDAIDRIDTSIKRAAINSHPRLFHNENWFGRGVK